jgi:hypothetical protein
MIVPVIESDQQAQDAATGVADVVSGTHRDVTDVTRHELFGYCVTHPQINSHLSRTLKIPRAAAMTYRRSSEIQGVPID